MFPNLQNLGQDRARAVVLGGLTVLLLIKQGPRLHTLYKMHHNINGDHVHSTHIVDYINRTHVEVAHNINSNS